MELIESAHGNNSIEVLMLAAIHLRQKKTISYQKSIADISIKGKS